MRNDEVIVSTRNVFKSFGKQNVLKDINLEIIRGEIFGLLGPSGAGKTTLVKQLVGLDLPTSGENFVFQKRMPSLSLIERIGYMAQSDALYGELSAKENLEFFAALYGLKGKRRQTRIKEVMEIVELSEHLNKLVSNYSGGMKSVYRWRLPCFMSPNFLSLMSLLSALIRFSEKTFGTLFMILRKKAQH